MQEACQIVIEGARSHGIEIARWLGAMITLTRLNGSQVTINALLIERLESTPDTVVTLTTGHKVVVQEAVEEVVRRAIEYLKMLRSEEVPLSTAQLGRVIK